MPSKAVFQFDSLFGTLGLHSPSKLIVRELACCGHEVVCLEYMQSGTMVLYQRVVSTSLLRNRHSLSWTSSKRQADHTLPTISEFPRAINSDH